MLGGLVEPYLPPLKTHYEHDNRLSNGRGYINHAGEWFQLPGPNSCWVNFPEMLPTASVLAGGVYERFIVVVHS